MKDLAKKLMAFPGTIFTVLVTLQYVGAFSVEQLQWPRVIVLSLFFLGVALYVLNWVADEWGNATQEFKIYKLKPNQIDTAILLSKKLLPETPSRRTVKSIYQTNNSMIYIQYRMVSLLGWNFHKPTGFCSIMPMKNAAKKLLDKEQLSGISFTPQHIAKPNASKACLYIGSIAANGLRAKKDIIMYLKGRIDNEVENGLIDIYTRPTSKEGLHLARKFGFEPIAQDAGVDELNRIYKLNLEEFTQ